MQRHTSPHDSRSGRRSASRTTGEPERRHKRSQLGACRTDWHTAFQKREECTSWRRTSTSTDADPAQKKATRAATTSQRRESKRQTMTRNTGEAPDAETNSLRAKHTGTDSHSTGTKRQKHTSRTRHGKTKARQRRERLRSLEHKRYTADEPIAAPTLRKTPQESRKSKCAATAVGH